MKILIPRPITDAMIAPGTTLAEPGADETVWVAKASYITGERRIRVETHRIYQCVQDHKDRATLPENDPAFWLDYAPTNRYAAFDDIISTQAAATGALTIALSPGFFNAVAIYGLQGETLHIRITANGGSTLVREATLTLREPPDGWYDWLFGQWREMTQVLLEDIEPWPDALLTLQLTAGDAAAPCAVGLIALGDCRDLLDGAQFGGAVSGSAEPITYSSIKTDEFGRTVIKRRNSATNMRAAILLPRELADYALACVQEVLGVPAAFIAESHPGFKGLNCFGLASATLSYEDFTRASLNLTVQGLI